MQRRPFSIGLCLLGGLLLASCTSAKERARADSLAALSTQQAQLMSQLSSQRDSVSQILVEASTFIGKIDSSISRVKGFGPSSKSAKGSEGALEDQVRQRKDLLRRVDALVARARETARQVAQLKETEKRLLAENGQLKDSLSTLSQKIIADAEQIQQMQGTIEQQAQTILAMQQRLDDFDKQIAEARTASARAYYVIGTEDELLQKGIVVREGGANLLIKRVGRTLVPARTLDQTAFTPIDTREVHAIGVPDTTKRYQIVSRQSLDDVKVATREGTSFRGTLEIPDANKFWSPSKYLIIVQR